MKGLQKNTFCDFNDVLYRILYTGLFSKLLGNVGIYWIVDRDFCFLHDLLQVN